MGETNDGITNAGKPGVGEKGHLVGRILCCDRGAFWNEAGAVLPRTMREAAENICNQQGCRKHLQSAGLQKTLAIME